MLTGAARFAGDLGFGLGLIDTLPDPVIAALAIKAQAAKLFLDLHGMETGQPVFLNNTGEIGAETIDEW